MDPVHSPPVATDYPVIYSASQIDRAIDRVAQELLGWIQNDPSEVVLLTVMNGAQIFSADLQRKLPGMSKVTFDSIRTRAYDPITTQKLEPAEVFEPYPQVSGKRVVIVEDICDSGQTIVELQKKLLELEATEIVTAVLLNRVSPEREIQPTIVGIHHHGKEWFVGFGMDPGRNLPYLGEYPKPGDSLPEPPQSLSEVVTHSPPFYISNEDGALNAWAKAIEAHQTNPDAPPQASQSKILARMQFLFEIVDKFFNPDDDQIIVINGEPLRLTAIEFFGGFILGDVDAEKIELVMIGENSPHFKTEAPPMIIDGIKEALSQSQAFQDGASSTLAAYNILPEQFGISLSLTEGGSSKNCGPKLTFTRADAQGVNLSWSNPTPSE